MTQLNETGKAAPVLVDANQFTTTGPIAISYTRSSISGVPLLSYRDAELNLSFSDEEINRIDTGGDELVTVTLQVVVDAFVRTFTLVVPRIRLSPGDEVEFETLGVETIDRTSTLIPAQAGVLQSYRAHQLSGVAQQIIS